MLPKFLLCRSSEEPAREFVLHTFHPYFLAEVTSRGDRTKDILPVLRFEPIPPEMDVMKMASLMRQLGDWYLEETSS